MSTVQWFQMVGFRPAITTPPHRHDEVDYPRVVPAPDADEPYSAKFEMPITENDTPLLDQVFADIPLILTTEPLSSAASLVTDLITTYLPPFWINPPGWHNPPTHCHTCVPPDIVIPPPDPAPVPLPPTALLLLVAIASLNRWRRS